MKTFREDKFKENKEKLESMVESLKNDIWKKLEGKSSIESESNENKTRSINSKESLEISLTDLNNVIIISTPKSNKEESTHSIEKDTINITKESVTKQRKVQACKCKVKNLSENNSEIDDKVYKNIKLSNKEINISNSSNGKLSDVNEIDILCQSSFLNNLELGRNSVEGIQMDQSADTIIVENSNETEEELTRQNEKELEINRIKKVKNWIEDKINLPSYNKKENIVNSNNFDKCKLEVRIELNKIDMSNKESTKNLEKETFLEEEIQILGVNEEKISLNNTNSDKISKNSDLDNKNSSKNIAKEERTIYEHTQHRWRASEDEANMKSSQQVENPTWRTDSFTEQVT